MLVVFEFWTKDFYKTLLDLFTIMKNQIAFPYSLYHENALLY